MVIGFGEKNQQQKWTSKQLENHQFDIRIDLFLHESDNFQSNLVPTESHQAAL